MAKLIPVNVTLAPDAAGSAESTLAKLRTAGLRNATLLEAIGIVSGFVSAEHLDALKKVKGVTVEKDESIQIAPPDAPVQ
jgi:hypothetical protein